MATFFDKRYQIIEKIGQGGMGEVYKAYDSQTGRLVALKILSNPIEEKQRFLREAKVLAKLSHPNIVLLCFFIMPIFLRTLHI